MKSNPFATRFVRPGQLAWLAEGDSSVAWLAARFRSEHNSRAIIVGPHGTGKTTLLRHLLPHLGMIQYHNTSDADRLPSPAASGNIVWLAIRRQQSPLRCVLDSYACWRPEATLVVDGLEQLRSWERCFALALVRYRRIGILATCHRPCSFLPVLYRTAADTEIVRGLVERLLDARGEVDTCIRQRLTDRQYLGRLLAEERGNTREVFMRLHDVFEQTLPNRAKSFVNTPV